MSSTPAPTRRPYQSARRREQAEQTRATVVATATRLFGEQGWSATGMRDIAREAGVSVETVYANFASKADLLKAAIDVGVVGDTEQVPLAERSEFSALGTGSRAERIRAAAALVTSINERTVGVNLALREATRSEPQLDRMMREREDDRRRDIGEGLALVLGHQGSEQQVDVFWAMLDVALYQLLTDLRGWTAHQYEAWLADAIDRLLADPRA